MRLFGILLVAFSVCAVVLDFYIEGWVQRRPPGLICLLCLIAETIGAFIVIATPGGS